MRGSLFMVISMAAFTANDAITKLLSSGMHISQIMLVRGIVATTLIAGLTFYTGQMRSPRNLLHPAVAIRILAEVGATITFLMGIGHLPLANATAIMQALPLSITLAAVIFMQEPVGWRRWSAIIAGFIGVVIIVKPGFDGFNSFALYTLASVLFCTVRDLVTRRLPSSVPSMFVSTWTAAAVTLAGALLLPFGGWTPLPGSSLLLLSMAAVVLLIGYHFVILAMRVASVASVAPFRYTALIWSLSLGFIVFGEVPDAAMIVGASIIVLSGIYAFYRERVASREMPATRSTSPIMAPDGI